MRPGIRWLLLACLVTLPFTFTAWVRQMDLNLYDSQLRVTRTLKGNSALSEAVALMALDDISMDRGYTHADLQRLARETGVSVVSGKDLEPFFRADQDGTLRGVTLVEGKSLAPPLLQVLAFRGISPDQVQVTGNSLWLGNHRLTLDSQGRVYPIFPFTEVQNGGSSGPLQATGFGGRFSTFLRGLGTHLESLTAGSLCDIEAARPHLKGKLVILGSRLKISDDLELPTPTGNMVSLDLYAATVDALLKGDLLTPLPWGLDAALTLVFVGLVCWILPGKPTQVSAGLWVLLVTAWLALQQWLFWHGMFSHQAPALVMASVALFTHVVLRSRRLARFLKGFGGGELLEQPEAEIVATICFTNLPGSIKELEKTDPDRAQTERAAYARCLGQVVSAHGGRLVDQQGDAQMLAFGLDDEPNHAALALACALDIVKAVSLHLGPSEGLLVHCGVVTGKVARGQVGGGSFRSVAAIGDTTNAAARLMGQAQKRGLGVLASRTTTAEAGPRLECRPAGEVTLRGRQEPLLVDEIVAFHAPPKPLMVRPSTRWPRLGIPLILASVVLSLMLAARLDDLLPFHLALFDSLTPSASKAPVVLAGIDEESLRAVAWPWPRRLHAQVIENCRRAGVGCVFFDVVFDLPGADDRALIEAVRANPWVLLAATATNNGSPQLIGELHKTDQWGLINVPPSPERDRRSRTALWQLEGYPGIGQAMARVMAPENLARLKNESTLTLRWGPSPRVISYHRLLDGNDPIFAELKGALVVIGDNRAGLHDSFETPLGQRKGAYIHCMTAQTLMTHGILLDRRGSLGAGVLALVLAILTLVLGVRSIGLGDQVTILVGLELLALALVVGLAAGGVYVGTQPLLVIPVALLFGIGLKTFGLSRALTTYVPPSLQMRLDLEDSVPDKTLVTTVLVTDIRGYTGLSEHRSPLEILKLLNRYHELTARCYEAHGGALLTYQGDAQLVVFGALEPLNSPVLAAVRAAQELAAVVGRVTQEIGLAEGETFAVGAGIATGRMTISLIRAGEQLQYTVLGEPVRRAHGLQSLSNELASPIVLDQASAEAIGEVVACEPRDNSAGLAAFTLI